MEDLISTIEFFGMYDYESKIKYKQNLKQNIRQWNEDHVKARTF